MRLQSRINQICILGDHGLQAACILVSQRYHCILPATAQAQALHPLANGIYDVRLVGEYHRLGALDEQGA